MRSLMTSLGTAGWMRKYHALRSILTTVTVISLLVAVLSAIALAGPKHGKTHRYTGTEGNDQINVLYPGRSVVHSLGGDDVIVGERKGASMRVFAGAGNDRLLGNSGPDVLNGGGGNDTIEGNEGNDRIVDHGGKSLCRATTKPNIDPGPTNPDPSLPGSNCPQNTESNKVYGGPGNDKIDVQNGSTKDSVSCGEGRRDVLIADRGEGSRRGDCERVIHAKPGRG